MQEIFRNKNVLYTSIGFFFVFFGYGAAQQYLVPLLKLQGRENAALYALMLLYGAYLAGGIITPKFIKRWGPKASLIGGAFTYFLFVLSVSSGSIPLLYAVSLLIGFGAAFLWISSAQIIADASAENTMGRNLGFQNAIYLLGSFLGVVLGGLLVQYISLRVFYLFFAVSILISFYFFRLISGGNEIRSRDGKFHLRYIFKKKFLLLFPIIFSAYFVSAQAFAAINLIVLGLFGFGFVATSAVVFRLSAITGSFLAGRASDLFGREKVLIISAVLGAVGLLLFLANSMFFLMALGLVLMGLFTSATQPVCLSLLKDRVSGEEYSYAVGVFSVYATFAVVSALFATRFFGAYMSFIPGIIFLFLAFPALFFFKKMEN